MLILLLIGLAGFSWWAFFGNPPWKSGTTTTVTTPASTGTPTTTPASTGTPTTTPVADSGIIIGASVYVTASATSVDIEWTTTKAASSQIIYELSESWDPSVDATGASFSLSTPVADEGGVTSHKVTISGLTPDTEYYYYIKSTDGSGTTSRYPANNPDVFITTK